MGEKSLPNYYINLFVDWQQSTVQPKLETYLLIENFFHGEIWEHFLNECALENWLVFLWVGLVYRGPRLVHRLRGRPGSPGLTRCTHPTSLTTIVNK